MWYIVARKFAEWLLMRRKENHYKWHIVYYPFAEYSLVRRKILRLYLGCLRFWRACGMQNIASHVQKNRLLFAHTYFLIKCSVLRKSLFRTLKRALWHSHKGSFAWWKSLFHNAEKALPWEHILYCMKHITTHWWAIYYVPLKNSIPLLEWYIIFHWKTSFHCWSDILCFHTKVNSDVEMIYYVCFHSVIPHTMHLPHGRHPFLFLRSRYSVGRHLKRLVNSR